jgi:hypothetical protein
MDNIPEFNRIVKLFFGGDFMQFIGVDLHTNKFTCSYRDENTPPDAKKGKRTETFDLTGRGLADFYQTLTSDTYVLAEATITSFAFVRLIQPFVKEVIVANTYELKQISLARVNTDKIDANILSRIAKMYILSGERLAAVVAPPVEIQELRGLFSTYRLLKKQTTQIKNHPIAALRKALRVYAGRDFQPEEPENDTGNRKRHGVALSNKPAFEPA